jgi:hypothetical protein
MRMWARWISDCAWCETNPIPGYAGRGEAPGAWDEGQMRKTNPIAGEARGTGPQGQGTWGSLARNKPNSRWGRAILPCPSTLRPWPWAGGGCAKQSQFRRVPRASRPGADCATSPRCPASGNKANSGRRLGRGSWAGCTNKANFGEAKIAAKSFTEEDLCHVCPSHRGGKTKPILTAMPIGRSAFPGAGRAKQTQFRAASGGPEPGRWRSWGPVPRNEANSPPGAQGPPVGAIMQNKPNSCPRRPRSKVGAAIVQNKANSAPRLVGLCGCG